MIINCLYVNLEALARPDRVTPALDTLNPFAILALACEEC